MDSDGTWEALLAGQQSLGSLKLWDLSTWSHQKVGELQNYQPATMLPDRKLLKLISRQDVTGISAGMQAVANSQVMTFRDQLTEEQQIHFSDEFCGLCRVRLAINTINNMIFLPLIKTLARRYADFCPKFVF